MSRRVNPAPVAASEQVSGKTETLPEVSAVADTFEGPGPIVVPAPLAVEMPPRPDGVAPRNGSTNLLRFLEGHVHLETVIIQEFEPEQVNELHE